MLNAVNLYAWDETFLGEPHLYSEDDSGNAVHITPDKLIQESMEITESLFSTESLKFGSCESSSLKLSVLPEVIEKIGTTKGKVLDIAYVYDDGDTEHLVQCRRFYIDTVTYSDDKSQAEIVAYDKLYKLVNMDVTDWYNSVSFPIPLRYLVQSFYTHFELEYYSTVELPTNIIIQKSEVTKLLGGTFLSSLAEFFGGFIHERYVESAKKYCTCLITLDQTATDISSVPVYTFYPQDEMVQQINSIYVADSDGDVGGTYTKSGTTGDNQYKIIDNFLSYGQKEDQKNAVAKMCGKYTCDIDMTYTPVKTLEMLGSLGVEVGDKLKLNDTVFYVTKKTTKGCVSLADTIECVGTKWVQNETDTNSTESKISKLKSIIEKTSENIVLKLDKDGNIVSQLEITENGCAFVGNKFVVSADNFSLDEDGNAVFSGKITGGTINIANNFNVTEDGVLSWQHESFDPTAWNAQQTVLNKTPLVTESGDGEPTSSYTGEAGQHFYHDNKTGYIYVWTGSSWTNTGTQNTHKDIKSYSLSEGEMRLTEYRDYYSYSDNTQGVATWTVSIGFSGIKIESPNVDEDLTLSQYHNYMTREIQMDFINMAFICSKPRGRNSKVTNTFGSGVETTGDSTLDGNVVVKGGLSVVEGENVTGSGSSTIPAEFSVDGPVTATGDVSGNSLTAYEGLEVYNELSPYIDFHIGADSDSDYDYRLVIAPYGDNDTGFNFKGSDDVYAKIYHGGSVTASSRRIKKNIKRMSLKECRKILDITPVSYDFKKSYSSRKDQRGFIAEDVKEVIPQVVSGMSEKVPCGIDYEQLIPYLVGVIQDQEKRIKNLENVLHDK
nr:MAG TPA: endosialidase chaperone [Caudoviricetes sp.]